MEYKVAEMEIRPIVLLQKERPINSDRLDKSQEMVAELLSDLHRKKNGMRDKDVMNQQHVHVDEHGFAWLPEHYQVSSAQRPRPVLVLKSEDKKRDFLRAVAARFKVPMRILTGGERNMSEDTYVTEAQLDEERAQRASEYKLISTDLAIAARDIWLDMFGEYHEVPHIPIRPQADLLTLERFFQLGVIEAEEVVRAIRHILSMEPPTESLIEAVAALKRGRKDEESKSEDGAPKKKIKD